MAVKRVALTLVVLGGLFAAGTLLKREPAGEGEQPAARAVSADERARIQRFWRTYREATELRIAGQTAEAAEAYARALEIDPDHHDALYYLGNMQFDEGNLAAAEAAWRRLVQIDPTSARGHSQLGTLYFCTTEPAYFRPSLAAAEFERASAINREETGPLLHIGEIALVTGDLGQARSYFEAVVGSHASSAEATFYIGYLAWVAGQRDRAADLLAEATAHAEPAKSAGVPGEGDTQGGAAPLSGVSTPCREVRARVRELVTEGGAATDRLTSVYASFDTLLQGVRRRIPP